MKGMYEIPSMEVVIMKTECVIVTSMQYDPDRPEGEVSW